MKDILDGLAFGIVVLLILLLISGLYMVTV